MKIALSNILSRVLTAEMIPVTNLDLWIRNIPTKVIKFTYSGKEFEFEWVLPKDFLAITDEEFLDHLRSIAYSQNVGTAQGVWERGLYSLRNATIPFELRGIGHNSTAWIDPDDFIHALDRYGDIDAVTKSLARIEQGMIVSTLPPDMTSFRPIIRYLEACQIYPRIKISNYSDLNLISLQKVGIPPRLFHALYEFSKEDHSLKDTSDVGFTTLIAFMSVKQIEAYCRITQAESIRKLVNSVISWYNTREGTLRDLVVGAIKPELGSIFGWEDLSVPKSQNEDIKLSPDLVEKISNFWCKADPSSEEIEFYLKWQEDIPEHMTKTVLSEIVQHFSQIKE